MCGFAGFLGGEQFQPSSTGILKRMADAISHRGPDDAGEWTDPDNLIGLTHRRLSIVDLSASGHQPMRSEAGRFVIAYNGEIYNHQNLRKRIDSESSCSSLNWRGHSDTETLLAGFELWGIKKTLILATGMFAFAAWDTLEKKLILGRDRAGEKPLYYGWQGDTFLFGSELKAFRQHPAFHAEIDRIALSDFIRLSYVPAPASIYKGIHKLMPGYLLSIPTQTRVPELHAYWSLGDVAAKGVSDPFAGSFEEASGQLESLLESAIRQQMVADVPLGAFLSGGVDSSTVVSLMQKNAMNPVRTFSIGFDVADYNEAHYAKAVATHLGTDHTELYVSARQAMDVIPKLPTIYDEPFADSSQIPTFLVSELARRHVTVSLSGDAGDELFCGYNRYIVTQQMWQKLSHIPAVIRKLLSQIILTLPPQKWSDLARIAGGKRFSNPGDKFHKGAHVMTSRSMSELYRRLVSHTSAPEAIVLNSDQHEFLTQNKLPDGVDFSAIQSMMYWDALSYLPDDILAKVDRAAMGVSLETRVPFLDHHVIEFAWTLPTTLNLNNGQGKQLLRDVLYRYVPNKLIERPKMGFGIPLDTWLRGPLKEWVESLLDETLVRSQGYLNSATVTALWNSHLSGKRNVAPVLWNILMFQAWLQQAGKDIES